MRQFASNGSSPEAVENLVASDFVLSVGTIDRRKNQKVLCDIWVELYDGAYGENLPQLVLVGRDDEGLSSKANFIRLVARGKILFLDGISDTEVARLYRACNFTVFPSTSEGYGLPVSESLSYGKLCLSSDLEVIKSHAGDLPWYFDPKSRNSLLNQLNRALSSPAERTYAEARIQSEFKPVPWVATVRSIVEITDALMVPHSNRQRWEVSGLDMPRQSQAAQISFLLINQSSAADVIRAVGWITANISDVAHEIIISSAGSDQDDPDALSFIAPLATVIHVGCDRFSGELFNIAAERASGRYICLLNSISQASFDCIPATLNMLQDDVETKAIVLLSAAWSDRMRSTSYDDVWPYNPIDFTVASLSRLLSEQPPSDGKFFDMMMFDKEAFLRAKGFDLAYEPGPYEDIDLITKALSVGHKVLEIRSPPTPATAAKSGCGSEHEKDYVIDLHRLKFVDRWSSYLDGTPVNPSSSQENVFIASAFDGTFDNGQPTAVLHTPFPLTPGGGERYLLSVAAHLSITHTVSLAVPYLSSRLRLRRLAEELSINLDHVRIRLLDDVINGPPPDLFVNLDNFIVPRQAALGKKNYYICQFPFPMDAAVDKAGKARLAGYQKIFAYSRYTRGHIEARLDSIQAPNVPVCLVSPPVAKIHPSPKRANTIMTVGRFFVGAHAKRHDLLIEAYKLLRNQCNQNVELHIVGSTIPEKRHMDYVERLLSTSAGLPIHFHFNAKPELLTSLYASTEFYWHGAGLETDLVREPWAAEHFGISLVEAMSAGAIPLAFASGGPREIIEHGVNGFLYDSIESLVESTKSLLCSGATERNRLSEAAARRAEDFSPEIFAQRVEELFSD